MQQNPLPIASPLFILREACSSDLLRVLERLKAIGFDGVEFLGFFGQEPAAVGQKMRELGLISLGDHVPYADFAANAQEVFLQHQAAGCRYLTVSGLPEAIYTDLHLLDTVMASVGAWAQMAPDFGLTLLFHNHAAELQPVEGVPLLDRIMDHPAAQALCLEPDLGWMSIAGADPLFYLQKYRSRCPVIHLKDYYMDSTKKNGPATAGPIQSLGGRRGGPELRHFEFRPCGYGVVNTPVQLPYVLACKPDFLVADHDLAYERDSFQDLSASLDYIRRALDIHLADRPAW